MLYYKYYTMNVFHLLFTAVIVVLAVVVNNSYLLLLFSLSYFYGRICVLFANSISN